MTDSHKQRSIKFEAVEPDIVFFFTDYSSVLNVLPSLPTVQINSDKWSKIWVCYPNIS